MKLKVYDNKNNYVCDIDNDAALLGSYPIDDGMRIHVIDNFTLVKDFDSSDAAERFVLQIHPLLVSGFRRLQLLTLTAKRHVLLRSCTY